MDLGEYDFEELYNTYGDKINFRIFAIFLTHSLEMEFRYKGEPYFIVNAPSALGKTDAYWFFGKGEGDKYDYCCRICPFEDNQRLVEFLENFKIDGLTLKKIFDEKISPREELDEDNCMTWIA